MGGKQGDRPLPGQGQNVSTWCQQVWVSVEPLRTGRAKLADLEMWCLPRDRVLQKRQIHAEVTITMV